MRRPDEVGKPPVSGYEVTHLPAAQDSAQAGRPGDSGEWGRRADPEQSGTDTSITLTGLTNEQAYQVRVRTLNEEGASAWSAPVSGTPVGGPVPVGVIPAQTLILGDGDVRVNAASAFTHPGEGTLTYGAASSDDAVATVSVSDSIVTIRPVAVGRATITVTANDGRWSATQEVAVAVLLTAPGICGRTPQVRAALLSLIPEVTDCALVTEAHLSTIRDTLNVRKQEITALKAGDFAGLSNLNVLRLGSNSLTALPEGIFLRSGQLTGPPAWRQCPEQLARRRVLRPVQPATAGPGWQCFDRIARRRVLRPVRPSDPVALCEQVAHAAFEGVFSSLSGLQSAAVGPQPGRALLSHANPETDRYAGCVCTRSGEGEGHPSRGCAVQDSVCACPSRGGACRTARPP